MRERERALKRKRSENASERRASESRCWGGASACDAAEGKQKKENDRPLNQVQSVLFKPFNSSRSTATMFCRQLLSAGGSGRADARPKRAPSGRALDSGSNERDEESAIFFCWPRRLLFFFNFSVAQFWTQPCSPLEATA